MEAVAMLLEDACTKAAAASSRKGPRGRTALPRNEMPDHRGREITAQDASAIQSQLQKRLVACARRRAGSKAPAVAAARLEVAVERRPVEAEKTSRITHGFVFA